MNPCLTAIADREQNWNMTGTLRILIADRYELSAYCYACHHRAVIDLRAMAERYGMDARVHGPRQIGTGLLKCSACGSARCAMQISPNVPSGPLPR